MKTIATDNNNDLYIDDGGSIAIVSDIDALANISKNAVLTNKGELTYNIQFGIPYMETIFADVANTDIFQASIIQTLESLEGIERVSSYSFEINNGIYSYQVEETTEYGTVVLNG